jgi:hypothetical protein
MNPTPQVLLVTAGKPPAAPLLTKLSGPVSQSYTITQTSSSQGGSTAAEIVTEWDFSTEVTAVRDEDFSVVVTCTAVRVPVFEVPPAPVMSPEESADVERIMGEAPEGAVPQSDVMSPPNPLDSLIGAVGVPVNIKIDYHGNMDFDRNPAPVEVGQYNQALATFTAVLDGAVLPWPAAPVGVGARWEVRRALGSVGNSATQITDVTLESASGSRASAVLSTRTVPVETAPTTSSTVLNDTQFGASSSTFSGTWRWEQTAVLALSETTRTIDVSASESGPARSTRTNTKLTRSS